jgi:hypothetical protein
MCTKSWLGKLEGTDCLESVEICGRILNCIMEKRCTSVDYTEVTQDNVSQWDL